MDMKEKTQDLKTYLDNLQGEYNFDFSREEDCGYFLEKYGGEQRLKKEFHEIYKCFAHTRKKALARMQDKVADKNAVQADVWCEDTPRVDHDGCVGTLGELNIVESSMQDKKEICDTGSGGMGYGRICTDFSCRFIDETKEVCAAEAAENWKGVTIQLYIEDITNGEELLNTSECIAETNSYVGQVKSNYSKTADFYNKKILIRVTVTGMMPGGEQRMKIFQNIVKFGTPNESQYCIKNIIVDDPSPKNAEHDKNQEIMMLYGRMGQQLKYELADYSGGDFFKNTFNNQSNTVHLLIPVKGAVYLNPRVTPVGLSAPEWDERSKGLKITRPAATYDYKQQEFLYRRDIADATTLYNRIKGNFVSSGNINDGAKIDFNMNLAESGRSVYDWHDDVRGLQDGDEKKIMLFAKFTYTLKNQIGISVKETVRITSMEKSELPALRAEYYKYDPVLHKNTIFIPPISVYWGCYARDVRIVLADGRTKNAEDICVGDQVTGRGGSVLTVDHVLSGCDEVIYRIRTAKNGEIRVSGGHPMMCRGKCVKASCLKPGDKLNCASGLLARIVSVEKIPYHDVVYNYTFQEAPKGAYIIANGFYSGDLYLQNGRKKKTRTKLTRRDKRYIDEWRRLLCC